MRDLGLHSEHLSTTTQRGFPLAGCLVWAMKSDADGNSSMYPCTTVSGVGGGGWWWCGRRCSTWLCGLNWRYGGRVHEV